MLYENIAAISTAPITSGVAVIRISGEDPVSIAEKMFRGKTPVREFEPYKLYVGDICADDITDHGMCVYFKAPRSFTGENMIEFHCHGGIAITKAILKKIFACGARPATNGEFTKRAFLNGKMSLSSAEGLIDMINAEETESFKAGYYLYRERLFNKIKKYQDDLKYVLAKIGANIDYPEEDIGAVDIDDIKERLVLIRDAIKTLAADHGASAKIKNGVKVVILGKPNAGKSSVMNALIGQDKAIVTSIAGTTRDVVEGDITIRGVRFCFSDTAGIRESDDEVEAIGISRSVKAIDTADVILFVTDAASGYTEEDEKIYSLVSERSPIVVVNKSDLNEKIDLPIKADVTVSAKTGKNIDRLSDMIFDRSQVGSVIACGEYLTEERHYYALQDALRSLNSVLDVLSVEPLDVLTIDIDRAWRALGLISGETVTEAVIDEIFSKFCVGK